MSKGTVYLIPVPIADQALHTIPQDTIDVCFSLQVFIVERAKTARAFLKSILHPVPLPEIEIIEIPKHGTLDHTTWKKFITENKSVGILSESGCPGIADPGSEIVAEAHLSNIHVVPLVGPSSILLSIMASGFSGQSFTFHGYLPTDKEKLAKKIKQLESNAIQHHHSHIFIETPYRNQKMLATLIQIMSPQSKLSIHSGLTSTQAWSLTHTIYEWKKKGVDCLDSNTPAVFIIGS